MNTTVTLLLRCTIEASDVTVKDSCVSSLNQLRDKLSHARSEYNWELGTACLSLFDKVMPKVMENISGQNQVPNSLKSNRILEQTAGAAKSAPTYIFDPDTNLATTDWLSMTEYLMPDPWDNLMFDGNYISTPLGTF